MFLISEFVIDFIIKVEIKLTNGKKIEHQGIKVELIGDIGNYYFYLNKN